MRDFLRVGLLLAVVSMWGCSCGQGHLDLTTSSTTSSGGTGGGDAGTCGVNCGAIPTPPCTVAVCNTGQVIGPLNTCVVVPLSDGTSCDDGKYCTINDTCKAGACVGGTQNTCGVPTPPCVTVLCYEETQSCSSTPAAEGSACTPTDLCQENGSCTVGQCVGTAKSCAFSPLNECNTTACDPTSGKCAGTPDATKDGKSCVLTGDLCTTNKTCATGVCGGGSPKDCTALDVGCQIGICDAATGICGGQSAPVGTNCTAGIPECNLGMCTSEGACTIAGQAPDGTACNDHDACTDQKTCMSSACTSTPVSGCTVYFREGFETCPDGWTLGGDWQCGTPEKNSPVVPHTGHGVIATNLAGVYDSNEMFGVCTADSPLIDLTSAVNPELSFWRWDHVECCTYDGWNLKVSTDGGSTYTAVTPAAVNPYNATAASQAAWSGDHEGWQNYFADLTPYKGSKIKLRFDFDSDAATVYTGVYLDDIVVAEPAQIPIYLTTPTPLPNVYVGQPYSAPMTYVGGTSNVVWSIDLSASKNAGWLTIDPTTGVLSNTPGASNKGVVTVAVRVTEVGEPTNFDEQVYTFTVLPDFYYQSFAGTCPNGWTLNGDWQCGTPAKSDKPSTCYSGTQCIGTQMAQDYSVLDTWTSTTATSPAIDLTGATNPLLTFRMWYDTEGTHDGANLQISTDGTHWTVVGNTLPPYGAAIIDGDGAWSGHAGMSGWQLVQADLTAYANMTVYLRFAFDSDNANNYGGVFIDDILIN